MAEPDLGRIKSNVAKMVAQGAPETDIDAYIAGEGTSVNAIREAKQSGFTLGGMLKAAGSGLVEGVSAVAGLPGTARQLVSAGVDKVLGPLPPEGQKAYEANAPVATPEDVKGQIERVTGPTDYEPQNTAEKYVKSVSSMAPGVVAGPGGFLRRVAEQVVLPGVAAQAAGDIPGVKGSAAEPYVRAAAAVAAPIASGRLVTPLSTAPTRTAAVQNLRAEGVDVSAGQSTGNKGLRKAEEELGGSTTQALAERQGEQFTAAVLRRVGENAQRATPEVIDGAFNRIGGNMNRLAAQNTVAADTRLTTDLTRVENEYNRLVAPNARAPVVQHVLDDIDHQLATRGIMDGDVYQALRSQLGADARSVKTDPRLQATLYDIQHALDDAMERSILRQNPGSVGEWREARTQYRNLLAVEKAVNSAGEAAAAGLVTPQNLARGVKQIHGQRDYSRGRNDLAVLARNGSEVMAPLANSNTAGRARVHAMLSIPGAILGGGAAHGLGAEGVMGGALAGAAVPRVAGEALIRGRRLIGNTLLTDRQTAPANLSRAFLGSRDRTLQ